MDSLFDQMEDSDYVDVFKCVLMMRQSRVHMVQTKVRKQILAVEMLETLQIVHC